MHTTIEKSSSITSSSLSSPQYHQQQPQHDENVVDNEEEEEDHDQHHHDGPMHRIIPSTTTTTTTSRVMIANSNNNNKSGGRTTVIVIFIISVIMIFNSILLLYQYHLSTTTFVTPTTTANTITTTNNIQSHQSSSMIPTLTSLTFQQQQHCSSSMPMMMNIDDETMSSSSTSSKSPNHQRRRIIHDTMYYNTSMEQDDEEQDTNHTMMMSMTTSMSSSASESSSSTTIFLWHVSIEMSMTIITNWIHAALLLVVGIIVYIRGDIIWMLYMYHTTFFWMIITFSSLIVYSPSIFVLDSTSTPTVLLFYIQYSTIWLFGICTMMVWYRYHPTYRITFQNCAWNQPQPHVTSSRSRTAIRIIYYGCQLVQYGMIGYYCSTTLQYLFAMYNDDDNDHCHQDRLLHDVSDHNDEMMIIMPSLDKANSTSNANNMRMTSSSSSIDMNDFVMSYSEVAHLTFILSLLQLSIVYPYSNPCCIGTALVAGWKLLLNTISLYTLVQSISSSLSSWTIRTKLSLFYTIYDILIMIPILFAALYLYYSNGNNISYLSERKGSQTKWTRLDDTASTTDHSSSSSSMVSMNDDTRFVKYGVVTATTALNDDDDDDNSHVEDGLMKVDINTNTMNQPVTDDGIHGNSTHHVSTFACRTTFQIASSSSFSSSLFTKQPHSYTWRQQYGAKLLSYGSLLLLIGMSLESIVLQSQSFLFVNHAKYDLYKWGLHLCVMYTFCTVMCMNVGVTYYEQYSRPILLLACPAGSLIAAYQCYNLWYNASGNKDIMSCIVLMLFLIRCICGIIQTVGVYLLNTIQHQQQPQQYHCATTVSVTSSSDDDDNSSHSSDDVELHVIDIDDGTTTINDSISLMTLQQGRQIQLQELHTRINMLFYYLFIPIIIVYIAMSVSGPHHHHTSSTDDDDSNNGMCLVEPNISPMIPSTMQMSSSCSDSSTNNNNNNNMEGDGFMLMPNIPGLGLYFHFGLVLLLFIYDGIQRTVPTYTPSLFLATIATYHLTIVLATDILIWDVVQTQFYTTISFTNLEIVQRIIQLLWSIISGYLAYSLHQFWNVRVIALHE